ncbi:MAG: DUF3990 domain-containing protein [Solobacterium sp.]|nr:DUF3990 domain-containing protein [Solobacterium sp.]
MNYEFRQDLESVLELRGMTIEELANELNVSRVTVSYWLNGQVQSSDQHMDAFYRFAYRKGIRLNQIKEQFYREDRISRNEVLLFHGAKTKIDGDINLDHSKKINDFGNGFYCGEHLEQAAMFVASYPNSSLYMLKFDPSGLKKKEYKVDREWMLTIAYYRGSLNNYTTHKLIKKVMEVRDSVDYIVAPIADNRMFEIIDNFIDGEITDVQCQHCLSATNLGMQYVFLSERALTNITLLERCYLAEDEKTAYLNSRQESYRINQDKVKLARKQYRNQGEYIEDILV